jgi:hypothetical protein
MEEAIAECWDLVSQQSEFLKFGQAHSLFSLLFPQILRQFWSETVASWGEPGLSSGYPQVFTTFTCIDNVLMVVDCYSNVHPTRHSGVFDGEAFVWVSCPALLYAQNLRREIYCLGAAKVWNWW